MGLFRTLRTPGRWLIFRSDDRLLLIFLGVIVGICSGLAALALYSSLEVMLEFFHHYRGYWYAILLPAIGAALSSLFLNKIMKEGAGHGVPEVIYSVSRYGGLMRFRSSFSRLISSCLTIGSGGSAGPEAPVVMSGAAIGSNISKLFSLNDRQRVTLVGCGAAGAIASIFNAPIAGMIFTMEVILGEWSMVNIIPIAIASVTGAEISRLLKGNQLAFNPPELETNLQLIIACIGLAVITAIASIILTRMLKKMHHISDGIKASVWVRAAIGGCIVGLIGFFYPDAIGEGYHAIDSIVEKGQYEAGFILIVLFGKIVATSFTLGWGGSGGIFAPSLVIGSFAGLAFYKGLIFFFPGVDWVNGGTFALLGMAGMISGILQAPLTGIFLIVEISGGYEIMLPLIVISSFSTYLCHIFEPASFYMKDLVEKGQLLRPGTDARVLTDLSIPELIEKDCIVVKKNMVLRDFLLIVKQSRRNYFPVEDENTGEFAGMVHFDNIRPYLFDPLMYDVVFIEQIMDINIDTVHYEEELSDVLHAMDLNKLYSMPVISNKKFIGMISKATILDQYRKELRVQTSFKLG